jgi:oxygen-independent coproporphyrinogen-3 oxidase
VPDQDTAAALFEETQEALEEAGLPAYEISNHARPGQACRHNLTYWRYGDYVGAGPGAHGRLTLDGVKYATRQHRAPEAWLDAVERNGHATRQRDAVDGATRGEEMLMMGLRLAEGIDSARFETETGGTLQSALDPQRLDRLIGGGFVVLDEQGLRATLAGRQRLNAVLAQLLA